MDIPKFYNEETLVDIIQKVKLYTCPHCKKIGNLILHGMIKGYTDSINNAKTIKGRRIFCSNRNRRSGCGRTWSIIKQTFIPNFTVGIKSLASIISNKSTIIVRWKRSNTSYSLSTFYRIRSRFYRNIPMFRTLQISKFKPPIVNDSIINHTIKHIKLLNSSLTRALAIFQSTHQMAILS